ncbi:MAG: hypothetical protein ACOCUA_03550 [archaeon]
MNRRRTLVGGISGVAGVLAGCVSILERNQPGEHEPQLEVFVVNALEESVRVTITASRGSTEFFSQSYTLAPGKGDESKSFVGTPTEIHVSIQNGRDVTRAYSVPASCESPELNVTIEPDDVMVTNGCVTHGSADG